MIFVISVLEPYGFAFMQDINQKTTNELDKQTETHGHGQQFSGYQREGG